MAMNANYKQDTVLLDHQTSVAANTASTTGSEVVDLRNRKGVASVVLLNHGVDEDTTGGREGEFTTKIQTASDSDFSADTADVDTFTAISMDTDDTSVAASVQDKALDLAACERYLRVVTEGDTGNDAECTTDWTCVLNVNEAY